jgi:SAM-dependent methyltransferase
MKRRTGGVHPLEILRSLAELDELMQRGVVVGNEQGEQARVALLCNYLVHDPILMNPKITDPFSREYRDGVLYAHSIISGRNGYQPARDELIPIDPAERARRPGIYLAGSKFLGSFLEAIGQILQVADLTPGQRVIEYGPGDGQIALAFARMGCDVTVLDIDEKNLETIRRQADMLDISIKTVHGEFSSDMDGRFDLVVFFETFHHAIDHQRLLRKLHQDIVSENGRILFAGEPIIPEGDYWADAVPFPWGMRLDALSLQAVKNYGWMELGFRENYFLEALARAGWQAERIDSKTNGRGTCYVAKRMPPAF